MKTHLPLVLIASFMAALPVSAASGGGRGGPGEDPGPAPGLPVEPPAKPGLIQTLTHDDFSGVTSITLAPGGKHAYAASFHKGLITLMTRHPLTGRLTQVKSVTEDHYLGAVAFRLSKDGRLGAASAFRSASLILFSRDPDTGELTELDHAGGADKPMAGLNFCVDNVFSPDGNFVYAVGADSIVCFKIEAGKLVHVETLTDPIEADDEGNPKRPQMSGARGVAVTPDGKALLTSWNGSGTLMVHTRDQATGKLTRLQALSNGAGADAGLEGVMHVTVSPDGAYAYTAGGRFGGENAVCTFSIEQKTGRLNFVQCLTGNGLPADYDGGNEIVVSPDGFQVAVACTLSDCLTRFARDPESGKLIAGKSFACGPPANPGACGVTYDSTGNQILVADENSSSIVVFQNR
ncbi:lactonase family protein [Luteolibacter flavescens]|uniref:Lactonase family protein n=1 Tax=Luteolibacter flavescens TaxID=1859460 RepID=A0ABT3FW13_9BACT|nr:lactonase family protein [Luteolibacter flavescens]MCW1887753.1 lactonase family protein [Luteolibacter flavescens]